MLECENYPTQLNHFSLSFITCVVCSLVFQSSLARCKKRYCLFARCFHVTGKKVSLPSNNNNVWFQEILLLCHLKSCNTATPHSSRPTQGYFPSAGFIKHLNISSIGSRRKDLAQFVGPKRKTLLFFPSVSKAVSNSTWKARNIYVVIMQNL